MDWLGDPDTGTVLRTIVWGSFVLFVLPGLFASYHGRLSTGVKHALVWFSLLLVLVAGYTYRDAFHDVVARVSAELTPAGRPLSVDGPEGERAVRIRKSSQGQFVARARVNGTEFTMMVDTGASSVVLKATDAARAGIDVGGLNFTIAVDTAHGSTFCAPIRLREISVGGIVYQGVDALVAQPGDLKESLLGMSFLKRLRSYDFSGDFLTLRS